MVSLSNHEDRHKAEKRMSSRVDLLLSRPMTRGESARGVGATAAGNIRFEADKHGTFARPPDFAKRRSRTWSWGASNTSQPRSLHRPARMRTRLHPRPVCPCAVSWRPSGPKKGKEHGSSPSLFQERNGNIQMQFQVSSIGFNTLSRFSPSSVAVGIARIC